MLSVDVAREQTAARHLQLLSEGPADALHAAEHLRLSENVKGSCCCFGSELIYLTCVSLSPSTRPNAISSGHPVKHVGRHNAFAVSLVGLQTFSALGMI
jgi:hypothetical protein